MKRPAPAYTQTKRGDLYTIDINTRCASHRLRINGVTLQHIDDSLFDPRYQFTYPHLQTLDVNQWIRHDLTGAMKSDIATTVICNYFNIPVEQIQSKTRKREIVQARQVAMFFSKTLTKSSLATIGSQIGGKDHATVLHACKTVNNLIETDKRFRIQVDEIEKKLKM